MLSSGSLVRRLGSLWRSPFVWLALICLVVYLPIVFGQVFFFRDVAHWNYPARFFLADAIRRGDSPAWNPMVGLGFSVYGSPLYGLYYPPNWLYALVSGERLVQLLNFQSFLHMYWGGAGVIVLARRFGLRDVPALIAGVVWSLSGYITGMWTAGILLLADAWIPWHGVVSVGLVRALSRGRKDWPLAALKGAVVVAMAILLGEVFLAIIGVGFGLLTAGADVFARRGEEHTGAFARRRWLPIAAAMLLPIALGAAVGALVVLPAREVSRVTDRSAPLSREAAEAYSVHPLRLVEFVAPAAMGDPYVEYPGGKWVGEPRIDGLPLGFGMYFGASAVLLAMFAFGRDRRLAWVIGGLAVVALIVAFGKHTPVHQWLRTLVPPLRFMRYPEKYFVLVVSWFALLVGMGAQRVLDERPSWRRVLGLGGVMVALCGVGLVVPADLRPFWMKAALTGTAVVAVTGAAALWIRKRTTTLAALLVAIVSLDLAAFVFPLHGFGPADVATVEPPVVRWIKEDFGQRATPPRIYRPRQVDDTITQLNAADGHTEGELRFIRTLIVNYGQTFGIGQVPGYDAAIPTLDHGFWKLAQEHGQAAMRAMGIDYAILALRTPQEIPGRLRGLEPMRDVLPGARLYRVKNPLPRAYLASRAVVASDAEVTARLFADDSPLLDPAVDAAASVYLANGPGARNLDGPAERAGACTIDRFRNTYLEATCTATREAVAVFLEQHDAGWDVDVDGQPAALLRANGLFRGVWLAAGTHRVVMRYTAPRVRESQLSALLGLTGMVALAVAGLVAARRERTG